jgi:hypothetical protein
MNKIPMVSIRNMGGVTQQFIDNYVDHRQNIKIIGVDTPKQAVEKILELITASK